MTTLVTDTSADPPVQQQSKGLITITILDVNEHPPSFSKPRNSEEPFLHLVKLAVQSYCVVKLSRQH